ncbi:hypothetical protein [uncultured Citricoccus sp.]|uniref:hypothetical protein n=1 Tax=uncultured Citricoccus sp. TaxID=614031 RepID=UPI00261CBFDB|nr:hypothetical protein [uncultured Citricoccus sp.]
MSTSEPNTTQPPFLATVTPLPIQSLEHRTRDLLHTLNAAGISATHDQAQALVEHGMTGLGCWTPSRALPDLDRAASQHFSIARRAQPAVRAIRKETIR